MKLALAALALFFGTAFADQPKSPDPPVFVCHFPAKVEVTLSVVALDTIALSLTKTPSNQNAYVQTLRELDAINAALRAKYCK